MQRWGNDCKFVAKHSFFKVFAIFSDYEGVYLHTKVAWRMRVCFRDKLVKLLLKPRGDFPVLALFSTCLSLRSSLPTPIKSIFVKLSRIGLSFHKVWLS